MWVAILRRVLDDFSARLKGGSTDYAISIIIDRIRDSYVPIRPHIEDRDCIENVWNSINQAKKSLSFVLIEFNAILM